MVAGFMGVAITEALISFLMELGFEIVFSRMKVDYR
jgi:hypothetical protein